MQAHIVNSGNRHQYLDEIEAMHRHRYRVFVDLMGWRSLESPDRLDIDEFDNANATYLIVIDSDGVVRGSARLMPTWRPNMLTTLFPEYVDGEPPVGPGIWEWTRHAPGDPDWPRELNNMIRHALHIGVLEFAASRGIEALTGIVETRILPRMLDMGWRVDPLGGPVSYGEGVAFAFCAPVDLSNIERLRKRIGRTDPVLVEMPRGLAVDQGNLARRTVELAMRVPAASLGQAEGRLRELVGADG